MGLSPQEMEEAIIRKMPETTGRTLDAWIGVLRAAPAFAKPKEAVAWLKAEHGLGHVTAQLVVRLAGVVPQSGG